jgi:hypothetical protein
LQIEEHATMEKRYPTLRFLAGRLACFLAAVAVGYLLASIAATQSVVHELAGLGVAVALRDRILMSGQDIRGMAGMFLPMVAFAYLVAFMAAALLTRWLNLWPTPRLARWHTALYMLAGGMALVMIHLTLKLTFGLTPIATARTVGGLALQALSGGVGGFAYVFMVRRWPV